jgi:hypothetical protein
VLGVGAGNKDGFNDALHAIAAALQDDLRTGLTFAVQELVATRRADEMPKGALQRIHQANSEL